MVKSIMPELKITKKVTNGHRHIVYFGENGIALASTAKDHAPEIKVNVETGEISAVDPDGYIHEIVDYEIVSKKSKEKDDLETVKNVLVDYQECFEFEDKSRQAGREAEKMYSHEQWEDKDKPSGDRAAVTVNVLEDKIDNLTGYQKQNRTEPHFLPGEKGDSIVADILNIVIKDICNSCYYQREKSKVFEDESIIGRGLFNVYEDYERDVRGNIIIERFQWDDCFFGPHDKEDLSDCEVMFKTKWYSESKIKGLYPEKFEGMGTDQKSLELKPEENQDGGIDRTKYELIDVNAKKYRLLERWKKEYEQTDVAVFAQDAFVYRLEGWSKEDIAALKTIAGMATLKRINYRMRKTRVVSDKLLEDEYLTDDDFEIIAAYGKFRKGKFWGKIEGVKDLQLLINKTYSQFIDIIAKVANYGYFYDADTFDDIKDEEYWRQNASSPGFTAKVANSEKPPKKEEGVKFPTEIVNAIQLFSQNLREIMNVNLSLQGISNNDQSGVAIRQKVIQQLIGNDFLFDNMKFAEQLMFKIVIKKIQKLYTPERIYRIVENQNIKKQAEPSSEGVILAGKPMSEYPKEAIMALLETVDLTDHDIIVSDAPDSPSAMMGAYLMMLETARTGAAVPPDMFINLSPLPEALKMQMLESLKAQQQQQVQSDQMKYSTEIEKTKIAHMGQGESPMGNMQPM